MHEVTAQNEINTVLPSVRLNFILNKLMKDNHLDDRALSKLTGIAFQNINRLRNNPKANPTTLTLLPIARFFNITIGQLIGEEPLEESILPNILSPQIIQSNKVPIISWNNIKNWLDGIFHIDLYEQNEWISTMQDVSESTFALKVMSDKFFPVISRGSSIIIETKRIIKEENLVLLDLNDEITIKQIFKNGDDTYIKSLNPEIKSLTKIEGFKVLGIIIEIRYLPIME